MAMFGLPRVNHFKENQRVMQKSLHVIHLIEHERTSRNARIGGWLVINQNTFHTLFESCKIKNANMSINNIHIKGIWEEDNQMLSL